MAGKFVLTAEINLQSPKNLSKVASDINKALGGSATINVDVKGSGKSAAQLKRIETQTKKAGEAAKQAGSDFTKLGRSLSEAVVYIAKYDVARRIVVAFSNAVRNATSEAVKFERELIKVSQVTGKSIEDLRGLTREITRLAVGFGVSSKSLIKTTRILAQTGLTAKETRSALEALAKSTLAPTFDDITSTAETSIAAMSQFGIKAKELEKLLGRINAVAGKFAVEAGDIGVAIRRAGGAFKSAGGEIEELIALFTSVRSTTRETAETIATGFRTIFTRMQRPSTIRFLKEFGVNLQNLEGKFVGPYEAVRRLNVALKGLDPRDVRYSQIVEQLGGFRQVSKVIPLIQQFDKAQSALNVTMKGGGSLAKDAQTAQASLAVQFTKTKESFTALIREISEDKALRGMIDIALKMAEAFLNAVKAIKPLIPLLLAMSAIKLGAGVASFVGGRAGRGNRPRGGAIPGVFGFSKGGFVPGKGNRDTVPAMLEPGEFVVSRRGVSSVGAGALQGINRYAGGGRVVPVGGKVQGFKSATVQRSVRTPDKKQHGKSADALFNAAEHVFNPNDSVRFRFTNTPYNADVAIGSIQSKKKAKLAQEFAYGNIRTRGRAYEEILIGDKKMEKSSDTGGSKPFDGKMGSGWIEAKSRTGSSSRLFSEVGGKALRQKLIGNRKIGKMTAAAENILLKEMTVQLYRDDPTVSRGGMRKKLKDFKNSRRGRELGFAGTKRTKKAKGGAIGGGGGDTVPALLTPGEFVINKKSAGAYGYSNLGAINRYAGGGVVSGGKHRYASPPPTRTPMQARLLEAQKLGQKVEKTSDVFSNTRKKLDTLGNEFDKVAQEMRELTDASGELVFTEEDINREASKLVTQIKKEARARKDGTETSRKTITSERLLAGSNKKLEAERKKADPATGAGQRGVKRGVDITSTLFLASAISATVQSFVDVDSATGKFVTSLTSIITTFGTLLAVTTMLIGSKIAENAITKAATFLKVSENNASAFKSFAPAVIAAAFAAWQLGRAMSAAADAAAAKAVMESKTEKELQRRVAEQDTEKKKAGAVSGAGIVGGIALLAAIAGPVGWVGGAIVTALGAAVGAIIGWTTAADTSAIVMETRFKKAGQEIEKNLDKVISGEKELGEVIGKINDDLKIQKGTGHTDATADKNRLEKFTKALEVDFAKRIKNIAIPEDLIITNLGDVKSSSELLSAQQEKSAGVVKRFVGNFGKHIDEVAKSQGISSREYIAALHKQSAEATEAAFIQARLNKALRESAEFAQDAANVSGALRTMSQDISKTTETLLFFASGLGQLGDRFTSPAIAQLTEITKKPEDILDMKVFNKEVERNANFLKRSGLKEDFVNKLTNNTKAAANAIANLPNAIRAVSGDVDKLGKEDFATKVLKGLNLGKESTVIKRQLEVKILQMLGVDSKRKQFTNRPELAAKELGEALQGTFEAQQEAANLQNKHNQVLQQLFAKRIELESNVTEKQKAVLDLEDARSEKLAKLSGRERTLEELTNRRVERARKLLGKQTTTDNKPIEMSVASLINRYKNLREQIDANQVSLSNNDEKSKAIRDRTVEQIAQLKRASAALKELGDTSKEVAILEKKRAKESGVGKQKRDFLSNLVFGSDKQRREGATALRITKTIQNNTVSALGQIAEGTQRGKGGQFRGRLGQANVGGLSGIPQSRRGVGRQTFQSLGEVPIFGELNDLSLQLLQLGNIQEKEVRETLKAQGAVFKEVKGIFTLIKRPQATGQQAERLAMVTELNKIVPGGITVEQASAIVGSTTEEVKLLTKIRDLLDQPIEIAQFEELLARQDVKIFSGVIETQNDRFLRSLERLFKQVDARREQRLLATDEGQLRQAKAVVGLFKGLDKFVTADTGGGARGKAGVSITGEKTFEFGEVSVTASKFATAVANNVDSLVELNTLLKRRSSIEEESQKAKIIRDLDKIQFPQKATESRFTPDRDTARARISTAKRRAKSFSTSIFRTLFDAKELKKGIGGKQFLTRTRTDLKAAAEAGLVQRQDVGQKFDKKGRAIGRRSVTLGVATDKATKIQEAARKKLKALLGASDVTGAPLIPKIKQEELRARLDTLISLQKKDIAVAKEGQLVDARVADFAGIFRDAAKEISEGKEAISKRIKLIRGKLGKDPGFKGLPEGVLNSLAATLVAGEKKLQMDARIARGSGLLAGNLEDAVGAVNTWKGKVNDGAVEMGKLNTQIGFLTEEIEKLNRTLRGDMGGKEPKFPPVEFSPWPADAPVPGRRAVPVPPATPPAFSSGAGPSRASAASGPLHRFPTIAGVDDDPAVSGAYMMSVPPQKKPKKVRHDPQRRARRTALHIDDKGVFRNADDVPVYPPGHPREGQAMPVLKHGVALKLKREKEKKAASRRPVPPYKVGGVGGQHGALSEYDKMTTDLVNRLVETRDLEIKEKRESQDRAIAARKSQSQLTAYNRKIKEEAALAQGAKLSPLDLPSARLPRTATGFRAGAAGRGALSIPPTGIGMDAMGAISATPAGGAAARRVARRAGPAGVPVGAPMVQAPPSLFEQRKASGKKSRFDVLQEYKRLKQLSQTRGFGRQKQQAAIGRLREIEESGDLPRGLEMIRLQNRLRGRGGSDKDRARLKELKSMRFNDPNLVARREEMRAGREEALRRGDRVPFQSNRALPIRSGTGREGLRDLERTDAPATDAVKEVIEEFKGWIQGFGVGPVGGVGPVTGAGAAGTQEVAVKTDINHGELVVRLIGGGTLADETLKEGFRNIVLSAVSQEARRTADNIATGTGSLRPPTNSSMPIRDTA